MSNTTDRGEDLQLLSRVLVGLVLLGGDALAQRLREFEEQIEARSTVVDQDVTTSDETTWDLVRYLTLGTLARGQKRIVRGVQKGVLLSVGTANWMAGTVDKWTDNRLMRPFRRPIESRWRWLRQQAGLIVDEGRLEEQNSRRLASLAMDEIIDEIMEYVARDPELALLIREQIAAQSSGLAEVVADNTRQVTVAADDTVEGVVRQFLRRKPRGVLPPSPFVGKSQAMYRGKIRK
jgi:hypothetical protein